MRERVFPWRQGSVLGEQDATALGLVSAAETHKRVVVISHDCDLRNEKEEETIEVIVGEVVDKPDAGYTGARHPRRLHLKFSTPDGKEVWIALCHGNRRSVDKKKWLPWEKKPRSLDLSRDEKLALKQWLAARYARPAFPGVFEQRLRKEFKKKPFVKQIEAMLKPVSEHLVGLFFDLGEQRFEELPDGEPYILKIYIVHNVYKGQAESAKVIAQQLEKLFHEAYGPPESAEEIALDSCAAIPDIRITLADLRRVDQWRVEYMSLQKPIAGDFLGHWEVPP